VPDNGCIYVVLWSDLIWLKSTTFCFLPLTCKDTLIYGVDGDTHAPSLIIVNIFLWGDDDLASKIL
jgi:hypothetical protein